MTTFFTGVPLWFRLVLGGLGGGRRCLRSCSAVPIAQRLLFRVAMQVQPPFSKGAFQVDFVFPEEYPFKPPKVLFVTPIHHPNVDEKGIPCLTIANESHWKPATKMMQVIEALVQRVHEPDPDHFVRDDLAQLYAKDRSKFNKAAEEHTKQHALKRP
eukprot:m.201749 g.201749  ORF g.201749 m.201749 type:complete len:157 (+) comp18425_c0_seq9:529-999(+)